MRRALGIVGATLCLAACSAETPMQGYVEGAYLYLSFPAAGTLVERPATAGGTIETGRLLARLDDADERQAVAGAEAEVARAEAELANLLSGERPEEIAVIAAQLDEARAAFRQADEELVRRLQLREKGVVAQAAVDNAQAARDTAHARVEAIERQLAVAGLPARPEEIEAARRAVAARQATLAQARTALERRTLLAPAGGLIEQTYFEPGERVAAGQAVVSILPEANRKVRFFLPEPHLASVKPGDRIAISCDNCPEGLAAEITFIASEAEFTPPVIYSRGSREKLVFRVEARPLGEAGRLKVGQPLDVRLAGPGPSS